VKRCDLPGGEFGDGDETVAATYSRHVDRYLAEHAAGDDTERDADSTRVRCDELGEACGGYTCESTGSSCTVRAGVTLLSSPLGELSFLKEAPLFGVEAPLAAGANSVFQFYTGSQSVVRRDRLRAWPRAALAALGADGVWCSDFTGYIEAVWHAMFGEPLSQWPRDADPRLPLYLKWSVPTKYSYGDEHVI